MKFLELTPLPHWWGKGVNTEKFVVHRLSDGKGI